MKPMQTITLELPESVYAQIERAAQKAHRPIDAVLTEAVTAAAPALENGPDALRPALAQLAYLNDAALWQAARATMTARQRRRLESLHDKQHREKLSDKEQSEEEKLLTLYRETVLVRAQAAALLHQRGYAVSDPQQFAPLT